jgi:hypothetical protein
MIKRTLPWKLAVATLGYFGASIGALSALNLGLPMWLEQLVSLLGTPALILLTAWNPLLKRLGMVSGEWITLPSALGCIVLMILYAVLAYAIGALIARLRA